LEQLWLGAYSSNEDNNGTPNLAFSDIHLDNVYVDSTRARVEIGNAATWAACTRREVQPSTAWASGAITATYQKGALSSGANNWVYVINAAGVPTAGFQITLP
jgi:hypothetical protein